VHLLFSSTQEEQHQTPEKEGSCQTILQIIFSSIKMQFTGTDILTWLLEANSGARWKSLSLTIQILIQTPDKVTSA
jgi:hypothetical protein